MRSAHSEIAYIFRQLALLLHAGVSFAEGICLLGGEDPEMKDLLGQMGERLSRGAGLAEAMEATGAFPVSAVGMVRIGEETGRTEEVLLSLAQFYEQRSRTGRQLRQALMYPAMIMLLMLVVIGVLLIRVLPVFDEVYASLGGRLIGVAAGLLHLGTLLEKALPVLLAVLGAAAALALLYAYCPPFKGKIEKGRTARFGDRGVSRKFNNAHFARAVAMGLSGALTPEDALAQAGKLLSDVPAAAARYEACAHRLAENGDLAEALRDADFLPPAESRMLALGLREGSGERVLEEIADRLMEHAEEALEQSVAKAEPAMVLTASLLVGAILLSVMLPLMDIMSAIG